MAVSIARFVANHGELGSLSAVGLVAWALYRLGRWPLYGFVFGWFYNDIRGKTGIAKGLNLFVVLSVPLLLQGDSVADLASGRYAMVTAAVAQVLLTTMALGLLAGDLRSLRLAGYGSAQFIEIRGLGPVVVWASTAALAVGTSIGASLGGTVPRLGRSLVRSLERSGSSDEAP